VPVTGPEPRPAAGVGAAGAGLDLALAPEVAEALAGGRPVVALESTIFSHLGLPAPHNREALARCLGAVTGGAGCRPSPPCSTVGPRWGWAQPTTTGSAVRPAR